MVIFFAFGWSVLAWDLSMNLSMHFESTLYGWWFFMGAWLSALMVFTMIVMAWRRYLGADDLITEQQIHDIGKLCFAFTAFWGYLTFGQYLVIWYGNMGDETFFMRLRLIHPWKVITVASIVAGVRAAVLRADLEDRQGVPAHAHPVRHVQPRRHLAHALHRGLSRRRTV